MIEVKDLVKKYGSHLAVDHLSFTLESGKIYGFLGPNGAGKSTTMNIMTGYLGATNGSVLIDGHDILKEPEEAKKHIMPGCRLLDVCTGSGCILLSLLAECKDRIAMAMGVDISKDALQIAIANGNRMELPAEFRESDLFTHVTGTYDVIVSNPPYIATKELEGLMPEVREHEPILALDGMEDGLYFYRKIVAQAGEYLEQGGWLCFEIGYDQGEALKEMMTEAGYGQVKIIKDLAGLDRVAIGQKNNNWNAL